MYGRTGRADRTAAQRPERLVRPAVSVPHDLPQEAEPLRCELPLAQRAPRPPAPLVHCRGTAPLHAARGAVL